MNPDDDREFFGRFLRQVKIQFERLTFRMGVFEIFDGPHPLRTARETTSEKERYKNGGGDTDQPAESILSGRQETQKDG